jgi:hypothetical protein
MLCRLWGSTDVRWSNANWLWSECQLAEELTQIYNPGIDASKIYEDNLWNNEPEKRKRLIRLICKVKGEEFDETKEMNTTTKIKVEDIRLVVKSVLDIELKVKE